MRRRPPRTRGQAALLAVVGLVILAIGMYTTYNLSRTVYEKIKLQNAADAAAYSLATLEARSFNLIAYTNRAQIAHYAMMMEAQSLLSSATFTEGAIGWWGEVLHGIGEIAVALGRLLSVIPPLAAIGEALIQVGEGLKDIGKVMGQTAADVLKPLVDTMDQFTPKYISLMTTKNEALFGVSAIYMASTAAMVGLGAPDIVTANDANANTQNGITIALNVINAVNYVRTLDFSGVGMPGEQDATARRLMGEMANAARYGSGAPEFIAARGPFDYLTEVAGQLTGLNDSLGDNRWVRRIVGYLTTFIGMLLAPDFAGTTKLLTNPDSTQLDEASLKSFLDKTAQTGDDESYLALSDAIAAKDFARLWTWEPFASVVSGKDFGEHCRHDPRYRVNDSGWGTAWRALFLLTRSQRTDEFKCDEEDGNRHQWNDIIGLLGGGIQPYLSMQPDAPAFADPHGFNQPDVWIYLNKPPQAMRWRSADPDLEFRVQREGTPAAFDSDINEGGLLPGINVVSRAQAYYHRPGAWKETPNLFNPYWSARLAPVGAPVDEILGAIGLPSEISGFITDNIFMH